MRERRCRGHQVSVQLHITSPDATHPHLRMHHGSTYVRIDTYALRRRRYHQTDMPRAPWRAIGEMPSCCGTLPTGRQDGLLHGHVGVSVVVEQDASERRHTCSQHKIYAQSDRCDGLLRRRVSSIGCGSIGSLRGESSCPAPHHSCLFSVHCP